MPYRLRNAPWWLLALVFGASLWSVVLVLDLAMHRSLLRAVIGSLASGVLFGGAMGPLTARRRRLRLAGESPQEIAARDAVAGGPIPQEPAMRELALGIGERQLFERRGQIPEAVLIGLAAVGLGAAAFVFSPWYGAMALIVVGLGWRNWRSHRRLERRVDLLRSSLRG